MEYSVKIVDVYKNYAGENALRGISLNIPKGCLFGIIGADGAGKSTLLKICTTLITPDKGNVTVNEFDIIKDIAKIRNSIGYMPQKFSLYSDLSVRENMLFFADLFGIKGEERKKRMNRLLEFSRLMPFQTRRAGNLSGGMKQKLALCCTLIHTPQILFLDEPTTGVDPVSRKEFWNILQELTLQGITIIISTPYMDEAHLCDELAFMHLGKIVLCGKPQSLLSSYPFKLFTLFGKTLNLSIPKNISLPEEIKLLYQQAGNIKVALENKNIKEEDVMNMLKQHIPDAETIKSSEPQLEDMFIYILSSYKNLN